MATQKLYGPRTLREVVTEEVRVSEDYRDRVMIFGESVRVHGDAKVACESIRRGLALFLESLDE